MVPESSVQTAQYYVNGFAVSYRQDEFYIELLRLNPEGIQQRVELYMSPTQAKGLRDALTMQITDYETNFTTIPALEISKSETEEPSFKGKAEPSMYR